MDHANLNNVGQLLANAAEKYGDRVAVAETDGRDASGKYQYRQVTFAELNSRSEAIAAGFQKMGMGPGKRICLMVPPGIDFICLVFALFKTRAVVMMIDPGMGKKNLIQCLADSKPDGFITIPKGHIARTIYRSRFPQSRLNVVVNGFFPFCKRLSRLEKCDPSTLDKSGWSANDEAAIIFTTGSTGPPKGVLYRHQNFIFQAKEVVEYFGIEPGGVDISAFPLFALFNISTGCTTVFPEMDFTRPADINPQNLIDAASDWNANQSFGSPALWNTVSRYCETNNKKIPQIKTVLSAGAPVPPHVIRRVMASVGEGAKFFTPYGATESLPVACADSDMVLGETAAQTEVGKGTCVGNKFPLIEWRVIQIADGPISDIAEVECLEPGEVGELMVTGPVVTQKYVTREDQNQLHKVQDGNRVWHRLGDVGYLDEQDRFWFCGRKNHRVKVGKETLYTIPCEAIFNTHEWVYRSALVGVKEGLRTEAAIVVEPWEDQFDFSPHKQETLLAELAELASQHEHTRSIQRFYIFDQLPTDIRHNSKIFREQIAEKLEKGNCGPMCGC